MALIREYDPTTDYPALRMCFIELQAWEQSFEPGLLAPEEAADPYLAEVFWNCAESSGRIFLAEANGIVVGFVCVLAKVLPSRSRMESMMTEAPKNVEGSHGACRQAAGRF